MNWNLFLQFIGYAFLISIYAIFAWSGKVPVEGFIVVLASALSTLSSAHISASAAKRASDAAQAANDAASTPAAPAPSPTVVVQS
ncbi:hypothetical protein [Caballeronia sp. KNU42]